MDDIFDNDICFGDTCDVDIKLRNIFDHFMFLYDILDLNVCSGHTFVVIIQRGWL